MTTSLMVALEGRHMSSATTSDHPTSRLDATSATSSTHSMLKTTCSRPAITLMDVEGRHTKILAQRSALASLTRRFATGATALARCSRTGLTSWEVEITSLHTSPVPKFGQYSILMQEPALASKSPSTTMPPLLPSNCARLDGSSRHKSTGPKPSTAFKDKC